MSFNNNSLKIIYLCEEKCVSVNPSENYETVVPKEIYLEKTFAITKFCKCGQPAIVTWKSVDTKHNYKKTWKECINCAKSRSEDLFNIKSEIVNREQVKKQAEELLKC